VLLSNARLVAIAGVRVFGGAAGARTKIQAWPALVCCWWLRFVIVELWSCEAVGGSKEGIRFLWIPFPFDG
jgi:hypothetical protein